MRLLISPAKKMGEEDFLAPEGEPLFLHRAGRLLEALRAMPYPELKKLLACNDAIAQASYRRYQAMDLARAFTPALLAYEGIQYQYMAPGVFTEDQFDYIQEHLRILSGLYGVLRPFDGVIPYRLEMQAKLRVGQAKDLYEFWGGSLAEELYCETDCVVNLASKEYSICISRHQKPGTRLITCIFGEEQNGKIVEKGTLCKMARGEMVRFMAERRITVPEDIRAFDRLDYRFSWERSNGSTYTFLRRPPEKNAPAVEEPKRDLQSRP